MASAKVPRPAWVFLVLCVGLGAGTAWFAFAFLVDYGTTSGSWTEGALDGLQLAAIPMLLTAALGTAAFAYGRRSTTVRGLAVAAVALSTVGVLSGGAQAAAARYETLPRVPDCDVTEFAPPVRSVVLRQ